MRLPVAFLILAIVPCGGTSVHAQADEARTQSGVSKGGVTRVEQVPLDGPGRATQGIALTDDFYYGADNQSGHGVIHRFDTTWQYQSTHEYPVHGVNHIGAISHYNGFLWAGFLNSEGPRKSVVLKIDTRDMSVVAQFDITDDVTWIDPVCFDGTHVWVGDMSDMGIHRYRIEGNRLVRVGVLRYPNSLHFSQGLQVRDGVLYSMHTFGNWDGLVAFDLKDIDFDKLQTPFYWWPVPENRMHQEGFDFVPGNPSHIWHAQGALVERFELAGPRD